MKSIIQSLFVLFALSMAAPSMAQKSAFIDLDSLLSIMPEMADAKKSSADHYKQLESTLMAMQKELNDKLTEYQTNEKNYTDLIKQTKQKELQDLDQRIKDFQLQAQNDFQTKNEELTKPINEKAKKAIEKVAKAKGYKMVIDTSVGILLYFDPTDDIFNAVKAEMGLK